MKVITVVSVLLAVSSAAIASTPVAKVKKLLIHPAAAMSPSALAAKADLAKMVAALTATEGLSLESATTVSTGSTATVTYTTVATLEKPDKITLQVTTSDNKHLSIYSDGSNTTLFDPIAHQYAASPTTSLMDALRGIMSDSMAVYGADGASISSVIETSFTFPANYLLGYFGKDEGALEASGWGESKSVLGGKPVIVVTQSMSVAGQPITAADSYTINAGTYLPIAYSQKYSKSGVELFSIGQTFTQLQPITTPLVASTYAFTPPAGAKQVTVPQQEAELPLLKEGVIAPEFTVNTAFGKPAKLSDYLGKVVVVDFWATWCGPCQSSLPHTDTIAKVFAPKQVVFLPICSWDDRSSFTSWLKAHKSFVMSFYFDPAGQDETSSVASKLYNVSGIPTQYVIGKDGKIVASFVGYDPEGDPAENALRIAIKKAMAAGS